MFRDDGEAYDAVTDDRGNYRFFDLAPGEWKVLTEPEGYYPVRTAETLGDDEKLEVTYIVERRSYNPYDVLVEARRMASSLYDF